jgi:type IV secretory pathway VirB3-like protein
MGSVVIYAAGNAVYPRLFGSDDDPVAVSALQTLIGGLILLAAAPVLEAPVFPMAALAPLLYLAIAGSVVAHTATLILVRDAGPVFASSWLTWRRRWPPSRRARYRRRASPSPPSRARRWPGGRPRDGPAER